MAVAIKRSGTKKEKIHLRVGNIVVVVEAVPADEVARANARIRKKVQPVFRKIKKIRSAAAITAGRIILNA